MDYTLSDHSTIKNHDGPKYLLRNISMHEKYPTIGLMRMI